MWSSRVGRISSYKDTSPAGLGPRHRTSFSLHPPSKDSTLHTLSHSKGLGTISLLHQPRTGEEGSSAGRGPVEPAGLLQLSKPRSPPLEAGDAGDAGTAPGPPGLGEAGRLSSMPSLHLCSLGTLAFSGDPSRLYFLGLTHTFPHLDCPLLS